MFARRRERSRIGRDRPAWVLGFSRSASFSSRLLFCPGRRRRKRIIRGAAHHAAAICVGVHVRDGLLAVFSHVEDDPVTVGQESLSAVFASPGCSGRRLPAADRRAAMPADFSSVATTCVGPWGLCPESQLKIVLETMSDGISFRRICRKSCLPWCPSSGFHGPPVTGRRGGGRRKISRAQTAMNPPMWGHVGDSAPEPPRAPIPLTKLEQEHRPERRSPGTLVMKRKGEPAPGVSGTAACNPRGARPRSLRKLPWDGTSSPIRRRADANTWRARGDRRRAGRK
jgi:hypothetical protein